MGMLKENFSYLQYTYAHRRAFEYVMNKLDLSGVEYEEMRKRARLHDMDKMVYYTYFSKQFSSDLHRSLSSHHLENDSKKSHFDLLEAIIDYECAGYTKIDKPLNAFDTVNKYRQDKLDLLLPILKGLNLASSYTVKEDIDGMKYIQQFMNPTERMISDEISQYICINPTILHDVDLIKAVKNLI